MYTCSAHNKSGSLAAWGVGRAASELRSSCTACTYATYRRQSTITSWNALRQTSKSRSCYNICACSTVRLSDLLTAWAQRIITPNGALAAFCARTLPLVKLTYFVECGDVNLQTTLYLRYVRLLCVPPVKLTSVERQRLNRQKVLVLCYVHVLCLPRVKLTCCVGCRNLKIQMTVS